MNQKTRIMALDKKKSKTPKNYLFRTRLQLSSSTEIWHTNSSIRLVAISQEPEFCRT